jgi:heme oxygenase
MAALLGGELDVAAYAALAAQLWFVYDALEAVGDDLADNHTAAPFCLDELRRRPGLTADLRHLVGDDWQTTITALPSTRDYVARLRAIAADRWAGGWIAHHYTRYLGDLAGGQVVRSRLRTIYGIDGDGARFYAFDKISNPAEFRRRYRAALDSAPFDADEQRRVVDEAVNAFVLNIAVLDELAEQVGERASA